MNASAPISPRREGSAIATAAVIHALGLIIFLAWRFGGMDTTGRSISGLVAAGAPIVTIFAWRAADSRLRRKFLQIVAPLVGIGVLVGISTLNPNMQLLFAEGEPSGFIDRPDHFRFLPSSIWPADSARNFLFNAGFVLIGLNLFLAQPSRRLQQLLLGTIAVNAAILACVGTLFKLSKATAIFGTYPSPNPNFFASFVYYNHWGAFALLSATAAAALALHFRERAPRGRWLQSPAPLLGVLTLLLLMTLPLSSARASTAAGLFLAGAIAWRLLPRRGEGPGRRSRLVVLSLALVGAAAATGWLARENIRPLFVKTSNQIADLRSGGMGDARLTLYKDTWKLVREKPIFGWGWHSFRYAFWQVQSSDFRMENEQRSRTNVQEAHNDWLQLLAELGFAGGALAATFIVVIARVAPARRWGWSPSAEIGAGLMALALLALVDFPFACPAVTLTAWTLLMTAAAIAFDRDRPAAPA